MTVGIEMAVQPSRWTPRNDGGDHMFTRWYHVICCSVLHKSELKRNPNFTLSST